MTTDTKTIRMTADNNTGSVHEQHQRKDCKSRQMLGNREPSACVFVGGTNAPQRAPPHPPLTERLPMETPALCGDVALTKIGQGCDPTQGLSSSPAPKGRQHPIGYVAAPPVSTAPRPPPRNVSLHCAHHWPSRRRPDPFEEPCVEKKGERGGRGRARE